jgi:hypothetical protein
MAICLPDEDWALALAREAVTLSLDRSPNQSEVTGKLVVTTCDELRISRSLVYWFRLTNHMVGGVVPSLGFDRWLLPDEPRRRR